MKKEDLTFTFDPTDFDAMRTLMEKYGHNDTIFFGVNTKFEETTISIYPEKIIYVTYQHNGWVRRNTYWRDGTREETFDGRWKTHGNMKGSAT